jgi:hypothetical protein
MRARSLCSTVAVLLLGCGAAPPSAAPPRAAPTSPAVLAAAPGIDPASMPRSSAVLLRAARYFDGRSDGTVGGGVAILVENLLITAFAKGKLDAPEGAEVIDLGEVTLLPGFIDAHTHASFESFGRTAEMILARGALQAREVFSHARVDLRHHVVLLTPELVEEGAAIG